MLTQHSIYKDWIIYNPNEREKWSAYRGGVLNPTACLAEFDSLESIQLMIDSYNNKVDPAACCEKAVWLPCVCAKSFRCPEHGDRHMGTHD
jgi:hypothetical protein